MAPGAMSIFPIQSAPSQYRIVISAEDLFTDGRQALIIALQLESDKGDSNNGGAKA